MRKTVQRVFKYQGKRILVKGESDKDSQEETQILYPAFVEVDGGFIPLTELEKNGKEIHTRKKQ